MWIFDIEQWLRKQQKGRHDVARENLIEKRCSAVVRRYSFGFLRRQKSKRKKTIDHIKLSL
jgi:hypothetical protein